MLADIIFSRIFSPKMMSFMALDGVMPFLHFKDVTNTCKLMRSIGWSSSAQVRKVERS